MGKRDPCEKAKSESTIHNPPEISLKENSFVGYTSPKPGPKTNINKSVIFQVVHIQPDVMNWDDLNLKILLYLLLERLIRRECL